MPTTQPPDAAPDTRLAYAWACFDQGRLDDAIQIACHVINQSPLSLPNAHAALGWFLLSAGSVAEAQMLLVSAIGRHPEYAPLHWYLGLAHLQEHRPDQASQALLAAVTFDPSLDEAAVSLAWALGDLGRLDEAAHYARQALTVKVQPDRLAQLGWLLLAQEKWQEAEPLLAQALALQPGNTEARCHLATALQRLNRSDAALTLLAEGLALLPHAPVLLQQQIRVLLDLGRIVESLEAVEHLLVQAPEDAASHALAALVNDRNGDLQAASEHAEKSVALAPQSADAWRALAQVRTHQHRVGEAAQALQTVLDLDPVNTGDTYRQLAWVYSAEHRFGAAMEAFTAALEKHADDASAWYGLAQAQHATENFAAALASVEHAVRLRGGWLDARVLQGRILVDAGADSWDVAVAQLADTVSLQPDHTEVRCLLATALRQQQRYEEALTVVVEGLGLSPTADDLQRLQILLLLDLRRISDAHAACRRLLKQHPQAGANWHVLALVFVRQKKPGMALRALARARSLAPTLAEVWQQTGWLSLESGDLRTARQAALQVLALSPEKSSSDILAAAVMESCGDLQTACVHAEKALNHNPKSGAAWRTLAQVRARQGRPEDATAALLTALELDPANAGTAYRQLGWVCIADRRFGDAIAAFSSAVDKDPDDAASWYGLAEAHRAQGHLVDALKAVKHTLGLREEWNDRCLRGQILHEQVYHFMNRNWHDLDATPQPAPILFPTPITPPAKYDYVLCSLSTKSHLHLMRTLAASARRHFSGRIYLLVVDSDDASLVPEGTTLVRRSDIVDPSTWQEMVERYNILELCCALKSYLMRFLAKTVDCPVVYLDADTYLMAALDPVLPENPNFSVFLTPHLFTPLSGARHADEVGMLAVGAYNGGMVAIGKHPDGVRFVDWWLERVTQYAYDSREQGVFTDQKWLDLVPSFFRDVHISRAVGLNVGHWRVCSEQDFTEDASARLLFCGEQVSLLHMSGFKPDKPDLLAQHLRPPVTQGTPLSRFLRKYAQELIENKRPYPQ